MSEKTRTLALKTPQRVGQSVKLNGWVKTLRDHGKVSFIDLRDRSGVVQCVGSKFPKLTPESAVEVSGKVVKREKDLVNPNLQTGHVEVKITKLKVLSLAAEIPLPLNTDGHEVEEPVRLKYRYLDLRRPRMTANLRLRSQATKFIRDYLLERDFVEIETPILTKTTPEGARDFIVPSRLQKGKFYALPQSPQQYKQLLMVAGFERYFQIARCFRDEDPRADRAYGEFTQVDLEMSFVDQNDILELTEELFITLIKRIFPKKKISQSPWPRIAHVEAMEKYGTDKPDLRKNKTDKDELAFAWIINFPLFVGQTKADYFHGSGAKYAPSHNMFTAPHPEDVKLLDSKPLKVRGLQHDLVLNGFEVGGGAVRIHQPEIQEKVFSLIGLTDKQKQKFDHFLTAFNYGAPPHGGIAPGLDRFLMAVLGEPSLREVMAFPMTAGGVTAVMNAPSKPTKDQLKEVGISIEKK
jgi:aspartyl-tRNA synthetase